MGVLVFILMRQFILPFLVTLVILYVAVTQLDWNILFSTLMKADLSLIAFSFVFWFLLFAGKVIKWRKVIASLDQSISWSLAVRTILIGFFISIITPGRLGDFARAAYLTDKMPMGKGILAVFLDRILDIAILLLFAGIGTLLLLQSHSSEWISAPLVVGLFILFLVMVRIGMSRRTIRWWVWPLVSRFAPATIRLVIEKYGKQFYDGIPIVMRNKWIFIQGIMSGVISWIFAVSFGWYILLSLGIDVSWWDALTIIPIVALVEVIPVGVLGVGTREVAAVLVLSAIGIPPEAAVSFSLLYFALGYIPSFAFGALAWNRSPFPIKGGLKGFVEHLKSAK